MSSVNLSWLEAFFILTTIASLVFNVLQWRDRKASQRPLTNLLIALFNDIKAKSQNVYFASNALWNPNNPHTDLETLRWEYGLFANSLFGYFQGFQETVVGALVTLNPSDFDGRLTFRAQTYGLTDQEREWRETQSKRWMEQSGQPQVPPEEQQASESSVVAQSESADDVGA